MIGLEDFVAENYSRIGKIYMESDYMYIYVRILVTFLFLCELKYRSAALFFQEK